jgi:hypothetical protein
LVGGSNPSSGTSLKPPETLDFIGENSLLRTFPLKVAEEQVREKLRSNALHAVRAEVVTVAGNPSIRFTGPPAELEKAKKLIGSLR